MHRTTAMTTNGIRITTLCITLLACGCSTFSGGSGDELEAEIRQVPGKAEYTIFGPHRLRALLTVTGLPETTSEESAAAARAGTYDGPVVWTLQGTFTFGTDAHRALEPQVIIGKSKPEHVEILLTVVLPSEEMARISVTGAPINATFTASPQAKFRVRVTERKK